MTSPQELVERALELSKADGAVVIVDEKSTVNLRWANNTLTTNGLVDGRSLTVVSTVDGASGTAAGVVGRAGVDFADLADLVAASEQAARDAGPAEDARPLLVPGQAGRGSAWTEAPAQTSIEAFGRFAPALGEAFARAEAAGRFLFGFAQHTVDTTYLGTSTGVRLRHAQPTGTVEINAKTLMGTDSPRSAWSGAATRDLGEVDVAAIEDDLVRQLAWATNKVDLPAGRYETVLPPGAVADLMLHLYVSASARDAADGRSVFARAGGGTRIGEKLADLPIRLFSDPDAAGLQAQPFHVARTSSSSSSVFDNGAPLRRTEWIADGALGALLTTRHSAQAAGLPFTPTVDNLVMEGPDPVAGPSLADMVASTERGLLLNCLWYIRRVDPQSLLLTGLTRDGVYLVEHGEVVGAVNNFRFNESPVGMLRRITEVGRTVPCLAREWGGDFSRTAMPALRVPDFNMSSVSQAS